MKIQRLVTKDNILRKINSYDIFKKYVSGFNKIGEHFRSELREDRHPTCVIAKLGNTLQYKDFAVPGSLDCFGYIMQKYCVNFQEALEMINLDFNLDLMALKKLQYIPSVSTIYNLDIDSIEKSPTDIKVQLRDWKLSDKYYWKDKYGITINDLRKFKVFPIAGFWINQSYFACDTTSYGYYFGNYEDGRQKWKIYRPFASKKYKWFTNCDESVYQGYDQLPLNDNYLIITKSCKDVIVLNKAGFPAIAPQAEGNAISDEIIYDLKNRFNEIILLYDNDTPGREATLRLTEELDIPHLFMPDEVKDASDYVEKYSYTLLINYITEEWNRATK